MELSWRRLVREWVGGKRKEGLRLEVALKGLCALAQDCRVTGGVVSSRGEVVSTQVTRGEHTMSNLIVENVPPEVYERLRRLAAARQRSVSEEVIHLLRTALPEEADAVPPAPELIPSEEIPAPCDLPLPGPGVQVQARRGKAPLPDLVGFPPE